MNRDSQNVLYKLRENVVVKLPYKDFDAQSSEDFRNLIPGFTKKVINSVLILDFSNVTFISGSGAAALMFAWRLCNERGIKLILTNLNIISLEYLTSKALDSIFDITNNLKEAVSLSEKYAEEMNMFQKKVNELESFFGNPAKDNSQTTSAKVYNFVSSTDSDLKRNIN
ncbi:MAG: STAS domain-containing protein [Cyanobacteriota bacterium]